MTDDTNKTPENDDERTVRFAIQTPFGTKMIDASELPEELRETLIESLQAEGIPDEVRAALAKALNIELTGLANPLGSAMGSDESLAAATGAATGASAAAGAEKGVHGPHEPGCTCAELHREHVWDIADTVFPDDPHLWQAVATLFTISNLNPHQIADADRRAALEDATLHIQRRVDISAPPLSSLEQLIAQFRKQMDS